ncbi:MAG: glutamate--tRNA ligase, partial [Alteraurantiacibacter sp.]
MASSSGNGSDQRPVVTRFAPSPTGFLHIGNARTGLFSWLYARHHGGRALLRIEDTDKKRSTQEAIDVILDGLDWLGLEFDGDAVYQSQKADRHAEVAMKLLAAGQAYKCFASTEELAEMREQQKAAKKPLRYDGRWRDRDPAQAPEGAPFTVRIKTPEGGETVIEDAVQGRVKVDNREIDDFILLRADGSPTYMLAVVVDDMDMGCTHVIRGDDHLNNAFRQIQVIRAMNGVNGGGAIEDGWHEPTYAHVPLIHGNDGAKLSKRHGALGVRDYREMGILPETLFNYLLRLGWGHGDQEEFSREEAISLFDIGAVNKGPSRFDMKKLLNMNGNYIRAAEDDRLAGIVAPMIGPHADKALLTEAMPVLKMRARDLNELTDGAAFLFSKRPVGMTDKAAGLLDDEARVRLAAISERLHAETDWTIEALEANLNAYAEELELGLG